MNVKRLVICDCEEGYAKALALYLMGRTELSLQVQVCSSISHVMEAEDEGKIDILFISEMYELSERRRVEAKKIFVLTAGNLREKDENEYPLYKYQSGEKILAELLVQCEELQMGNTGYRANVSEKEQKIIGVFSPVHRIGKTSYALRLGEKLAGNSNVLYLNLEIFGGVGGHFEEGGQSLADVLYYARQEKGNLGLMITMLVHHRNGLDYILPMPVSEDVKEIEAKEWMDVIQKILQESIYDTIILDVDEGIRKVYDLLEQCTEIHVLTDEEEYSKAKMEQFQQELAFLGYEDILRRMIRKEVRR